MTLISAATAFAPPARLSRCQGKAPCRACRQPQAGQASRSRARRDPGVETVHCVVAIRVATPTRRAPSLPTVGLALGRLSRG
jgi:hypothetical protein